MNLLGLDTVKQNFRTIGTPFTDRDNLTLLTAKLTIVMDEKTVDLVNVQDIHMAYSNYMPHLVTKKALTEFGNKYGKYSPNFRKPYTCQKCKKDFDYIIDPEFTLYQSFFE